MYRIGFFVVLILALALGLLVGTLNHEITVIDLLWIQLHWPLGLALLSAIAIGVLTGLVLTWLFSVLPLRVRLRKTLQRQNPASHSTDDLDA